MNPLNKETLNEILELADGRNSVLLELLQSFLRDTRELSEEITNAVHDFDWEKLQFSVHTLKGLSGTIGANPLFEVCKLLNDDLKNGNTKTAVALANSVSTKYEELVEYIKSNYQIEYEA